MDKSELGEVASSNSSRTDWAIAFSVFLVSFVVYALTACRTIYSGDSGDFIVATVTGGVPHPSGYPLFILLARLFGTVFPIGEWAFRINLFVALTGAIATLFVYLFLHLLLEGKPVRRAAALFGALSMAFGATTWSQATISEVYSLNLAFLAALLFYSLRWSRTPNDGKGTADNRLAGLCFLYGLAVTNHLTIVFVFPLFLAFVLRYKPALLGKQAILLIPFAGLILLPLALYAYLPLVTIYGNAPIRWSSIDSLDGLLFHLQGKRYSNYMFPGADFFWFSFREYFGTLLTDEFGALLFFAPVGLVALLQDKGTRIPGLLIFGIWLVETGYGMNYATPDIDAYYLPTYLAVACCIGVGASATVGFIAQRTNKENQMRSLRLAGLIVCLLPVLPLTLHYGEADRSSDYRERDYAQNILRSCPPNTVLILAQDAVFTLWYEQYVQKMRPDVLVLQYSLFTGADISYWYATALRRAYPAYTDILPIPDTPSEGDTGLIRLVEKATEGGHPILFLPASQTFPTPVRSLKVIAEKIKKAKQDAEKSTVPAPSPHLTETFDHWLATRSYPIPYGLCVRLYPRQVAGKLVPPPTLREIILTNASLWKSFALDGVFVNHWINDPDPLHYPMAGQYTQAITDYGKLAEQVGAIATARDCYQKATLIYPSPEAVAGVKRLAK